MRCASYCEMSPKKLLQEVHQSYAVVLMAVGIVAGIVLGLGFRLNYFASPIWIILVFLLLMIAFIRPKTVMMILAFIAGMILAFWRCAEVLSSEPMAHQTKSNSAIAEDGGNFVIQGRDWFKKRIESVLPEPEAGLGISYLLGVRSGLSDELNDNLRAVGLVHIVVASGAHLAILVEFAKKICGKVSRGFGVVCSVGFVLLFMCMVGWTPSILRAGIMMILTLVTWYYGRRIAPWRIILLVMAVTLIINPSFVTNLGWLMSFASYGGIMILGPKLIKAFYGTKKPGFIASIIITTISATIMTLPITLYYFGQISLISVVANLLILPTLPYAMGMVFLTGVVAGLPVVESAVAWFAKMILDFHIMVVNWFGGMKEFLIEIPMYQWWVYLIYLLVVILLVGGLIKRKVVELKEVRY